MKARPILFNGDMVRALLAGRKTQTRRIVKPQPPACMEVVNRVKHFPFGGGDMVDSRLWQWCESEKNPPRRLDRWPVNDMGDDYAIPCPHGKPGDLLWVRETFWKPTHDLTIWKADGYWAPIWTPSIHMPRLASRLTLRITDVRVQRLQDISEEDARAEGANMDPSPAFHFADHRVAFSSGIWDALYEGTPHSCIANPWVWAISFEVIHKNVGEVMA